MTIKVKNGSALLLAFLIMTSILVSVLYVSRFSLRQIKQSKSVDNANIAFMLQNQAMNKQYTI